MSFDKIQKLVNSLAKSVEDNEKIATPILAVKLAKYVEAYPHDQTLGSMSRVIEKMASNNTFFISKADLKSLYTKLYSRNTKFAELFQSELGITDNLATPQILERDDAKQLDTYQVGDQVLANALNSVFSDVPLKMYSQTLANQAKVSVATTLDAWSLRPTSLEVDNGSDKFLVIKADYETPKGVTSLYVPVEIHNNKIVEASVFMGNAGPQELNHTNIKAYLTTFAGTKLKVNGTSILAVLTKAASENRTVSNAEMALIKFNASKQEQSEFFQGQIVGQKVAEAAAKDVELPKYGEFTSFEKQFTSPYGQASWKFGDKVATGRNHIARQLSSFGHKNPQVTVLGSDDNTIFYGISLDAGTVAFTVPMKVVEGKLNKPSVLLCNGSISTFDQSGINSLYVNNQSDYKVAAAASPLFELKPSDLVNSIKQAVAEGNHTKAEDALNVLANANDPQAYAVGFNAFLQSLGSTDKGKTAEVTCSMILKNASSEHPICGHTGLPLHKVYQDKDGNCRPQYRKGMDETYEGASFMNAKIFG
jgi:hypothetical protein